jgi:hypothetical protein
MTIFNRLSAKLLFAILLIISSLNSYGQLFKGEVLLGGNLSQVEGDMVNGYRKMGFFGGLGIQFPFHFNPKSETKPWAASMEILFTQRGARQKNRNYNLADTINNSIYTHYKFKYLLKTNYVCLNFMLHYTDKERYTIGTGLAYNRLVNYNEIEFDVLQTYDSVARFKSSDLMYVLDLRCRVWQQLKAGFRFEYSILPIRTRHFQASVYYREQTRLQYNNSLSLYLIYVFNEKKSNVDKENYKKDKTYYY